MNVSGSVYQRPRPGVLSERFMRIVWLTSR
jgi:hypothetical protein